MNKTEAKTWMVENNLAENEFSAEHIWEGLNLWNYETEQQKKMVVLYREWRGICNNTKLCFAYVLNGVEIPKMYKEIDVEETLRTLGYG